MGVWSKGAASVRRGKEGRKESGGWVERVKGLCVFTKLWGCAMLCCAVVIHTLSHRHNNLVRGYKTVSNVLCCACAAVVVVVLTFTYLQYLCERPVLTSRTPICCVVLSCPALKGDTHRCSIPYPPFVRLG